MISTFSCFWTLNETSPFPGPWAWRPWGYNYTISSPRSPACWLTLPILRAVSLHNHVSQFLKINRVCVCMCVCPSFPLVLFLWRTLSNTTMVYMSKPEGVLRFFKPGIGHKFFVVCSLAWQIFQPWENLILLMYTFSQSFKNLKTFCWNLNDYNY